VSFRSDYGTDPEFVRDPVTHKVTARPRANHRNRVYVPINTNALVADTVTHRAKASSSFISTVHNWISAITTLGDVVGGAGNTWKWVRWSKKLASVANVISAWLDDRPDYQRRRTDQSGNKTTWTVTELGLAIPTISPMAAWDQPELRSLEA
jgi:hypothetical protein